MFTSQLRGLISLAVQWSEELGLTQDVWIRQFFFLFPFQMHPSVRYVPFLFIRGCMYLVLRPGEDQLIVVEHIFYFIFFQITSWYITFWIRICEELPVWECLQAVGWRSGVLSPTDRNQCLWAFVSFHHKLQPLPLFLPHGAMSNNST